MGTMEINRGVFECAANSLNLREVQNTLEAYNIIVDRKDKKHELVCKILQLLDENKLDEEVYLAIKTKAFSTNSDFYEGFFYTYNCENIDFVYSKFEEALENEMLKSNKSKVSNSTFSYKAYNMEHYREKSIVEFEFFRETRKGKYDFKEDDVKYFNEKIQAKVQINYGDGIVYIHCKNSTNSTTIKFFLQKVINELRIDKKSTKTKLSTPKFDSNIVNKLVTQKENFSIKGISSSTIHMLDLLCEFEVEKNNFDSFCMKKIYFGNEVIDTKEKNTVEGSIFFGEDIQECIEISEGILNGKKINGFELDVCYIYEDEEYGREKEITGIPITIMQENNNSIRTAISKDMPIEDYVLCNLYQDIRKVFLNKLKSSEIKNSEAIIRFIDKAREILAEKRIKPEVDIEEGMIF